MELRCLPETRLLLWRRSIALFHEFTKAHWVGPFREAGYVGPDPAHSPYIISRIVLDHAAKELQPDLISTSRDSWSVLELTTHPESKEADLQKYSKINPKSLLNYGLTAPQHSPNLFSVRFSSAADGAFAQLLLANTFDAVNLQYVIDNRLRALLEAAKGRDMTMVPEIPIAFLPESSASELRSGLVDIVMQLFKPGHPRLSAAEMVDLGLERISSCVSNEDKHNLATKVEEQLYGLVNKKNGLLKDDLVAESGCFGVVDSVQWHPKTLERIERSLRTWASAEPRGVVRPLDSPVTADS